MVGAGSVVFVTECGLSWACFADIARVSRGEFNLRPHGSANLTAGTPHVGRPRPLCGTGGFRKTVCNSGGVVENYTFLEPGQIALGLAGSRLKLLKSSMEGLKHT